MTHDNADLQFRALADFVPQLVWFTNHRGGTIWYNRRWYEYTGSNPDAMEGWGWVEAVHPDHAERALRGFRDAWEAGTEWEDTYPLRRHDGEYHWFLARAAPFRDPEGKLVRWFGTNTDVNDRIEAERLQELLAREINHRVKNNLALVSALLSMQARGLEGEARTAVGEAALRVSTVAQLHDLFWRNASSDMVDLDSLVRELCDGLQQTWPLHRLTVEAEPIELPVAKAVPMALILNELATNAVKHAYGPASTGEVRVRLSRSAAGEIQLEVRDFGRGLPSGFDLAAAHDSLGMKVIGALARQLGARLDARNANRGASFVLTGPAPSAEPLEKKQVEAAS